MCGPGATSRTATATISMTPWTIPIMTNGPAGPTLSNSGPPAFMNSRIPAAPTKALMPKIVPRSRTGASWPSNPTYAINGVGEPSVSRINSGKADGSSGESMAAMLM